MSEEKQYKIVVSDNAKLMLGTHIRFIACVNKDAARKTKRRIIESFSSLSMMPERFPFYNGEFITKNKYRRMFVEKWYLIIYQIQDDTVYIDYVIDCQQDYKWMVR